MRKPWRMLRLLAPVALLGLLFACAPAAALPEVPAAEEPKAPPPAQAEEPTVAPAPPSPSPMPAPTPAEAPQPTPVPAPTPEASPVPVGREVGQRAPEFTVTTLDGDPVSSVDLLAERKPFILYTFATW